jgi:hypothetical protein
MVEARIDWDAMYRDFTQGWFVTDFKKGLHKIHYPEPKELAERYNCSIGTIYDRIWYDRNKGIGDWRLHRKSIQAKRKEEVVGEGGGRFGFYVTQSAKLDAIALDTLEQLLTLVRLETNLQKQQRDEDLKQLEANPNYIKEIKSQSTALQTNARTIASVMETLRKVVGEPVTGIATQAEIAASDAASTDTESRKSEIERLLKRREQLSKRIEKIGKENAG